MNPILDSATHTFWEEDNIIFLKYKVKSIDLDTVKEGSLLKKKVFGNKPYIMVVDMEGVVFISADARKFLASEEEQKKCTAMAVIVPGEVSRLIMTFYLAFNKPSCLMKLFGTKQKAVEWLKDWIQSNSVSNYSHPIQRRKNI